MLQISSYLRFLHEVRVLRYTFKWTIYIACVEIVVDFIEIDGYLYIQYLFEQV